MHDLEVAAFGSLILHPPGLLQDVVEKIAAQESRDIVKNIATLNAVASAPAALTKTAAAKI